LGLGHADAKANASEEDSVNHVLNRGHRIDEI
jgi:hypothetical protein